MDQKLRKIIHVDMDCFYAAIEMRDNPQLKDKSIAVGGRPEKRGVISTCNYKAREFGVHSALSSREAIKRCPELIILPGRYQAYKDDSQKIRNIFKRYTSLIEPLSLDEAYLDVSECEMFEGSASLIAQDIRKNIYKELQLTASAGISNSKFLAKIASDWKKPNGQFTIRPDQIQDFMPSLPIEKIHGVGKATQKKMHQLDIYTCLDLQKKDKPFLIRYFGSWGERLYDLARGIDHRKVNTSRVRKSLSVERTFSYDLEDWDDIETRMDDIYEEFIFRLKKNNISGEIIKSLQVKLRYENFESMTRETQCQKIPDYETCLEFLKKAYYENSRPLRLIGLGVKLKSKTNESRLDKNQLPLF